MFLDKFIGRYDHTIDEKGRLTIPARFRELLGDGAFITEGLDKNLMVMTASTFENFLQLALDFDLSNQDARVIKRMYISKAAPVEFDKLGRIVIQQHLREIACLSGRTLVIGQIAYFEIWSPELWAEQERMMSDVKTNPTRMTGLKMVLK